MTQQAQSVGHEQGCELQGRRVGFRKPLAARIDLASEDRRVICRSAVPVYVTYRAYVTPRALPPRPAGPCLLDL